MTGNLLLSIIIPCYQYGRFLKDALESILKQTLNNWECIIVDDGSTDNTSEISQEYVNQDHRFHYVYQKNAGLAAARNSGIKQAKGKYVQFLDADDVLEPEKTEKQVLFLENNSDINIVYSDVKYFFSDNPEILFNNRDNTNKKWMPYVSGKGIEIQTAFVHGNILELGSAIFKVSDVLFLGEFNTNCSSVADWDICCRAAFKNMSFKYIEIENGRILMRNHISMSKNTLLMLNDTMVALKVFKTYTEKKELRNIINKKINFLYERIGYEYMKKRKFARGRYLVVLSGLRRFNINTIFRAFFPDKQNLN